MLHENAQEALQFLALGAGIILLLRLVALGLGHLGAPADGELAAAMAPFRNGYPLIGADTVVLGGQAIIPRIAVAFLFTLLCGTGLALLTWSVGRALRWNSLRAAVVGARAGLLLGGAWAVYCLLCLPPRQTQVDPEGLTRTSRPAFLRTIALPFPSHTVHWDHVEVGGYEVWEQDDAAGSTAIVVMARIGDTMEPIAGAIDDAGDGANGPHRQKAEAQRLAEALRALTRTK